MKIATLFFSLKYILYILLMVSPTIGKTQIIPTDVSNLNLWLRADSVELDNVNIVKCYDLSGNNNHASQTNLNLQPTFITGQALINNQPTISFDGINDYLIGEGITGNSSDFSFIIVAKANQVKDYNWFFRNSPLTIGSGSFSVSSMSNGGIRFWHNSPFTYSDFSSSINLDYSIITVRNSNDSIPIANYSLNGFSDGNSNQTASVHTESGYIIGTLGPEVHQLNGEIAEILLYSKYISDEEKFLIENYLREKYFPTDYIPNLEIDDIIIDYGFCDTTLLISNSYSDYLWSNGSTSNTTTFSTPGFHWVEVTNMYGYTERDSFEIIFPIITNPSNNIFCPSQTITWSAGLGNDYNYLWSNGETTESIAISSSGDYYVTVTDSLECQITSATFHFYEDDFQATVSLGPDVNICSGNQLALVSGSNEAVQYLWNTGETSTQITVSTSGTYYVDVINANGCTASDTINVNIIGEAPVILPVLPSEICAGEIFSYSESSYTTDGSSITTRLWNFGDGNTSSSQSGEHYFTVSDTTYTVSLTIGSDSGCSNQLQHTISVRPKPVFNFNSTGICQFNNIQFIGTTPETGFNNWNWNFGDPSSGSDNTASGQAASHTFTGSGTFNVSLMIESSFGCRDTLTKTIAIVPAPVVNFTFNDVCQGGIVSFINQSSIATPHQITSHLWNFGGSSSSTLTNPTRLYSSGGTFPVTLTVTSNNGCSNSLSKSVTIHSNPLINYTYSSSCAGLETRFSDHSTVSDGNISHVSWSFNGSPLISGTEVGFVFPGSGTHQVQQIVTSSFGCQQSSTTSITTHAQLKADFSTETGILAGTPIAFENKSIGADFYEWSIGTFYSGHETNPAVIFPVESIGQHITVKLISQNSQGCSDTAIHNYVIEEFRRDIAVTQILSDQDENGYTIFAVELRNLGTVPVTKANIYIRTNNTAPVKAMWEGQLTPGGNEVFLFPATSYQTENTEKNDFVCAEAEVTLPAYFEDDNLSNNEICKHLSKEGELILIPYPSPVTGELFIRVILPASETVELAVFDLSGKKVGQIINNQKLPKGLSVFSISTEQWNAGIYSIVLRGESEVRRVKITKL